MSGPAAGAGASSDSRAPPLAHPASSTTDVSIRIRYMSLTSRAAVSIHRVPLLLYMRALPFLTILSATDFEQHQVPLSHTRRTSHSTAHTRFAFPSNRQMTCDPSLLFRYDRPSTYR